MSELKSIHAFDVYKVYTKTGDDDAAQVYRKSEADTAIVEYAISIRHQKYKRCLAMAKWCAADCVVNQNTYKKFLTHKSEFRITHFRKWYFRWLELAEKFSKGETRCRWYFGRH